MKTATEQFANITISSEAIQCESIKCIQSKHFEI